MPPKGALSSTDEWVAKLLENKVCEHLKSTAGNKTGVFIFIKL